MSGRVGSCRHRVGTMSELVGMWRAFAMSMSKRDVIKKLMSSGLVFHIFYLFYSLTLIYLGSEFVQVKIAFSYRRVCVAR